MQGTKLGSVGALALACWLGGCAGDEGEGTLVVVLRGEETIAAGLEPGDDLETIVDGWSVRFDAFLATVGGVRIARGDGDADPVREAGATVVDLRRVSESGAEIARFEGVRAGRWDVFEVETPIADGDAARDESADAADFDALVDAEATFMVEGTIENEAGQSCVPGAACRDAQAIDFRFEVPADTAYGPCEPEDGLAGVAIADGGTTTVAITIHGDHLFFNGFPLATEKVERRAQWLADADLDGDDSVTRAELEAIDASELFDSETYKFGGAEIPIETAWDFAIAQMKTVVHFQGEGECPVMPR